MCDTTLRSTYPFFLSDPRSQNRDLLRWALRPLVRRTFSTPPRALDPASHLIDSASRWSFSYLFLISFAILATGSTASAQNAAADASRPVAGGELKIEKQLKMISADKTETEKLAGKTGLQPLTSGAAKPVPVVRDPRVLDAAKMYEKYFLGQMMKAMRSTVTKSDLEKTSMGEGIYREQLDDQYVDTWGERGGIGLADMIHDELIGKAEMMKLRRQAMKAAHGKVRTPMALTDRDIMKVRRLPNLKSENGVPTVETVLVTLGKTSARPEDGPESVRSSWAGKVQSIQSENGKVVLKIDADKTAAEPARKIELAYDGVPFQVSVGDVIKPGQAIGQLGRGARGILIRQTLVQVDAKAAPRAALEAEPEPVLNE